MNEQVTQNNTQSERILASISYFSIFFAPIIVPIIIWIFADKPTSIHAAKSLIYHIITYIGPIFLIMSAAMGGIVIDSQNTTVSLVALALGILLFTITIWYTIKNIYRGIKVLISDSTLYNP
ncbi:DUF4870 domain-containing protein [Staphylococcus pseudoxylosus]|uniref:DUF4870 domain-containing protein n=1 Tax=Staphylococcus pseudoxylosus TaxID=2282419 RepID=UPI001BDD3DDF|nr:DUF4870 domain-containing protein [Staphylococcus pseudoxylosus]MEB6331972.1 DUF4870 domain-containing protein [Staphylococcus pseudoxylosus]